MTPSKSRINYKLDKHTQYFIWKIFHVNRYNKPDLPYLQTITNLSKIQVIAPKNLNV